MSVYQKIVAVGSGFISMPALLKLGFNWSPMYRRSTARVVSVSPDLKHIIVKLAISYKNRNYMNSIFGGSMFAAVDPIPMIQLVNKLGSAYVVWDKSAQVLFKKPAKEDLYAHFTCNDEQIEQIKKEIRDKGETTLEVLTKLCNKEQNIVYCEVRKILYVADKAFYKKKQELRRQQQ